MAREIEKEKIECPGSQERIVLQGKAFQLCGLLLRGCIYDNGALTQGLAT